METAYDKNERYLGRLADAFADATRRRIYVHLREAGSPRSASEVAEVFGLHRTVARSHLEKLAEMDLVVCDVRRRAGGGRPAKTYALAPDRFEVTLPPRRYERLSRLLLRLIDGTLNPSVAAASASSLGRAFGEELAATVKGEDALHSSAKLSPQTVVEWMDGAGYDVSLGDDAEGRVVIEVRNCVYDELAREHPEIVCGFDFGMMCGMLGVDADHHRQTRALTSGDDRCRHEFTL
jgi:predicted ArsR family transcriptional regulator